MMFDQNGGPYVHTAVLCDKFIRGAESRQLSLINITEGITVGGPDADQMPPITIGAPLMLVISLWAGQTKGRYSLKLRPEEPSGLQGDPIKLPPVHFTAGAGHGVQIIVPMPSYEVSEEGTYWFDLLFSPGAGQDDRLLTRIPLTVVYQPQQV